MRLRPFFSFFGSKYRLGPYYPSPKYNTIIEPFAGSAGYSLLYPNRNITLYDIDTLIVQLWNWLIHVREEEILNLPNLPRGTKVSDLDICDEAKWLIGFWITESQTYPSKYHLSPSRDGSWNQRKKELIANQLQYIRHWKVFHSSYRDIKNEEATWYIDPPYIVAGKRYRTRSLDFTDLGKWCEDRQGQIIVCEQKGASWLPFEPLRNCRNASNKEYQEVIYTKEKS